jgi:hypothetical protein
MLLLGSPVQDYSNTAAALLLPPLLCQRWARLLLQLPAVLRLQWRRLGLRPLLLRFPASLASCQGARGEACALLACCGALAAAAGWTGTAAANNQDSRRKYEDQHI